MGRHPLWRARSCIAGETYRLAVGEASQLRWCGRTEKQHTGYTIDRKLLEHIGGSREVVAVVAVEQWHEEVQLENVSSAARSSG